MELFTLTRLHFVPTEASFSGLKSILSCVFKQREREDGFVIYLCAIKDTLDTDIMLLLFRTVMQTSNSDYSFCIVSLFLHDNELLSKDPAESLREGTFGKIF